MKTIAVIPGAGIGKRMESNIPKPLLMLKDQYIFLHTVKRISRCAVIDEIELVVHSKIRDEISDIIHKENLGKIKCVIKGGDTRGESVLNGLNYIDDDCKYVLIHDCARPLITEDVVNKATKELDKDKSLDGVIVGVPVKSTVKQVCLDDNMVSLTLNRNKLWEIQTPQVFRKKSLLYAYNNIKKNELKLCKDDAQVLEKFDKKIKIVRGNENNIKITTPEDLKIAEVLMNKA